MVVMVSVASEMPIPAQVNTPTKPQERQNTKTIFDILKAPFVKFINHLKLAAVRKELDHVLEGQMREELAKLIAYNLKSAESGEGTAVISRKMATGREIVPEQTLQEIQENLGIRAETEYAQTWETQEDKDFLASPAGQQLTELGKKLDPVFAPEDLYAFNVVADSAIKSFLYASHVADESRKFFLNRSADPKDRIRASIILRAATSKHAAVWDVLGSMAMIVGELKAKGVNTVKEKLAKIKNIPQEISSQLIDRIVELQKGFNANKPESFGSIFRALSDGAAQARNVAQPASEPIPA